MVDSRSATTFAWTIDDVGSGKPEWITATQSVLNRLSELDVRATLFVVPRPDGRPIAKDWRRFIEQAVADGHDVQLHGLTHENCWEFGPPNWPATDILPVLSQQFADVGDQWRPLHTRAALTKRISTGAAALRSEFGIEPSVFRAPCGATCKAMYAALTDSGIRYHSCEYISATGYDHLPHRQRTRAHDWNGRVPCNPFRWYHGVIEAPILNEWTWQGAWRHVDAMREVMRADVTRACSECRVAVPLMHTHGIGSNPDYAIEITQEAVETARQLGAGFATLGRFASDGSLDRAAVVEGPDILPY